jgi:lysophospholipase L1-like esterase
VPTTLLASVAGLLLAQPAGATQPLRLADGDRVVLIGNTLIEREQRDGYWETALTRRFPRAGVTFRNLGWSGDTVWGHARAGFGSVADGFRRLRGDVLALKPTVLVIAYGGNESFDGRAGLPAFVAGLDHLLDELAPAKARLVLLGPPRQEDLGPPLPDPAAHNRDLRLYGDAVREVARKRGALFVDLYTLLGGAAPATRPTPLTDNGLHLTPWGYWRSAALLEKGLGLPPVRWGVQWTLGGAEPVAAGTVLTNVDRDRLCFETADELLPVPPPPDLSPPAVPGDRVLRVRGLPPGDYTLLVDGKPCVTAHASAWARGVGLDRGPEFDQAERLRRAVVAKNELFFHRWRPQNDTYLYGFRRHEQGKNAAEVPRFDPLIARRESEIARLRLPGRHTYQLKAQTR